MNCLTCNYDRTGIDNNKPCPECGAPGPPHHAGARDRALARLLIRFFLGAFATYYTLNAFSSVVMFGQWDYMVRFVTPQAVFVAILWGIVVFGWLRSDWLARRVVPREPTWARSDRHLASGTTTIARYRVWITLAIRVIGFIAAAMATSRTSSAIVAYFTQNKDHPFQATVGWALAWSASPFIVAIVCFAASRRIARWIVPDNIFTRCLSCGAAFDKKNMPDTCPDCGWQVRTHKTTQAPAVAPPQ